MSLSTGNDEGYRSSEFQSNLEALRLTYFFSGLPMEVLKVIAFICDRETFRKDDLLFQQGDDDGQAFYIFSGTAELLREIDGQEKSVMEYSDGDFIGGLTLLGNQPRLFSMRATSDMVCIIVPREKFNVTIQQFPDVIPKLIKAVVERLNEWEERCLKSAGDEYCRTAGVTVV